MYQGGWWGNVVHMFSDYRDVYKCTCLAPIRLSLGRFFFSLSLVLLASGLHAVLTLNRLVFRLSSHEIGNSHLFFGGGRRFHRREDRVFASSGSRWPHTYSVLCVSKISSLSVFLFFCVIYSVHWWISGTDSPCFLLCDVPDIVR